MAQRIKAFGQILEFPDDMSDDDMLKHIKANEPDLNPDYSPPITDKIKSFARDSLGINTDALLKRNMSIADQAEASANEGENVAARQVPGAPVRQSTYNKALITPDIKGRPGITSRIASAASEDVKGQADQQELELLRTEALKPSESGFMSSAINTTGRTIKGAGQVGSDFLGQDKDNAITRYGQKLLDDNPVWVKKLEDIKDEPFLAFKEATGNSVGSMAGMIGVAGLGAGITSLSPLSGPAAPVIAAVGQAVQWLGPAAVAALPSYSGIRDAQISKNPKFEDDAKSKAIAAMGAAAVGAIEVAFGPQQWALAMLTKEGRAAMARKFASTSIGEAAIKGTLKGGLTEGFEEIPQNMLEQLASYEDPTTKENVLETLHGGAMGAIGGAGLGGVTAVASQINTNRTQRAMSDIAETDNVDDAIKVAGEAVSKKTVTPDDILKTVDPTLEDVINETQTETAQEILTDIVLPDNSSVKAQWRVVDADEVKASMKEGVAQPRDRTRAASDIQIKGIANAPDYRRLSDSPVMDVGAPVIDMDGNIVAGNGRFEGVSQAHDQGTSTEYLNALRQDAINKGIDPAAFEAMRKPILVRQIIEPIDTRKFAIASNSGTALAMSALEQSKLDAERMKGIENLDVNDLGDVALTPRNLTQLKDSLGDYTSTELGALVDKGGRLSQEGVKRVRNAMLAKAYGASPVLENLVESTDSNMRNVLGALTKSAAHVISTKGDVKPLMDAVSTYSQLKATGQPVDNFLAQQDAFSEGLSPEAASILTFIDANARSQKKLTDFFKGNFREVDTTSADMFEVPKASTPHGEAVSKNSAWVIKNKATGEVLFQTFDKAKVKALNTSKYEAVPIYDYLTGLNKDERIASLEKHLKENGYDFTVRPASVRNVDALDSTKKAHKELAEKQAKVFGKKVVFVEADGPFGINGVMVPGIKDTIFVDIRTSKPFHAVMGHELSHWMEVEKPDVYKDMVKSLKTVIKGDAEYAKKYGIDGATKAEITKEIVGDIMGDNFTEQSFWNKVASANPEAFKDIAAAIIKWLKGIIAKAKSNGMGSEEWVKDAVKAQDIVAQAVAKYTEPQVASVSTESDVKFKRNESLKHASASYVEYEFETGKPVTFTYLHNKSSATKIFGKPTKSSEFNRYYDPSGKYVTVIPANREIPDYGNFEKGVISFKNPLVIENDNLNWKKDLSDKYNGLRGKNLSKALIEDGYDGVVTIDTDRTGKSYPTETLDLTSFDYSKAKFSRDSEGKPLPKSFFDWFEDSKVVDDQGRPLVVYHGTSKDIEVFDPDSGKGKTFGTGSFFSSNPLTSNTYTGGINNGNVLPVYLSMQNPAVFDAQGANWNRINKNVRVTLPKIDGSKARNTTLGRLLPNDFKYVDDYGSTDDLARWAREQGYDGLIIKNVRDQGPTGNFVTEESGKPGTIYVVYKANQVKSATGNNGDFSKTDNRIHFSRSPLRLWMPVPRSPGWTEEKIIRALKSKAWSRSFGKSTVLREIAKFDSLDEFADHIYYHGTGGSVSQSLVPSITMSEAEAERSGGGGYGERYWAISLSKSKEIASNFTGQSNFGTVYGVILKKGANVQVVPGIQDAADIEDHIVQLWNDGVDAVDIGGGEQELAVLNPAAIVRYENGENFGVFKKKKFSPLTTEQIEDIYKKAKEFTAAGRGNMEVPEIKFSKQEIENALIAQHNLSIRNLIHADRMGGLAAPSIAVTDKAHPLTGFGEITLLSTKDMVDPKNGTKIFGSDIYSPRYPSISYDFSGKPIKTLNNLLAEGVKATGDSEYYNDSLTNDPFSELQHSSAAMYQFLSEQGETPDIKFVEPKALPDLRLEKFVDSKLDSFDLSNDAEFKATVKEVFSDLSDKGLGYVVRDYAGQVVAHRDAIRNAGKVDRTATNSRLFRQISDSNLRNKFDEYLVDLVDKSGPKERIFKGHTNAGKRQYTPHDIDTVIKILKKDLRGGENFKYGLGSIRAKYSPQFKSIEQIRGGRGRLMDSESFERVKKEVQTGLDDLNESLSGYGTFSGYDNVETMLSDVAKRGINGALKDNGFENVPDSIKVDIQTFINKLKDMPTEYFEAKILRAVGLGEFSTAIIPDDATPQVEAILKKNGIEDIRKYKAGDKEDRVKQINTVTHVMFSRAPKLYSKLEQALESASDKVFSTGPQVKLWLQGNAGKLGIKKDEIYWSGIDNWLDAQGKVSKQQVVEFVRNNGVKVEDVVLGGDKEFNTIRDKLDRMLLDELEDRPVDKAEQSALEDRLREIKNTEPKHNNDKLTLPGGTDYKELVVTVPTVEKYNESDDTHFGDTGGGRQIGWLRMNTRDGGLFIEELQSQRAQQGRSKGFGARNVTRYEVLLNGNYWGDFNTKFEADNAVKSASTAAGDFEINEVVTGRLRGVPPAPFVSDANNKATNAYITLLMKKAVIEAVSNDHASVSWATGDQQADRYDLSKQISEVQYDPERKLLKARDFSDNKVLEETVEPGGIADYVGKDIAKRLLESPINGRYHQLVGVDDLKVGGEWAQSMYGDERGLNLQGKPSLMSQAANDIFKHVGSGKVESINGQPGFYITDEMRNKDLPLFSKAPDETRLRKFQRMNQDSFNRFTVIRDWLAEQGIKLSDKADVYGAEERYHSKTANQLEDFREQQRNPLIEKIQKAGYTLGDIEVFLKMQHAQEANEAIRKIGGDTAYGITDEEASEYLAEAPKELATLANELRNITEQTKKLRLDNGILNTDITDSWEGAYRHYIPVKGEADAKRGVGKGLKVNFKSKRRLGHGLRDEHVIENILMAHERAIMEVERNRVIKHLIMMAAEMQRPDILSIGKPEKRKVLKVDTAYTVEANGVVQGVFKSRDEAKMFKQLYATTHSKVAPSAITINQTKDQRVIATASPMLADNEVIGYMNGHAIRVQINDELSARAFTKLGVEQFSDIVAAGRALNGYLSKMYTGYNPEFILTNMVRDFSSGTINLTGEQGFGMALKALANYPKAFGSLLKYAATNGKSSNKWIDSYRANGGNTGAAYLSDMERLGNEVSTEYASHQGVMSNLKQGDNMNAARAAGRKVFNATLKWIYNLNQAGENAMRLAAFKAMIDSGKTVNEAAKVAKNITVNFNRRGERISMPALYLFYNASIQGTAATTHALFKGKHKYQAQALAASMATVGYLVASSFGGGSEDDWDEVNDYTKERNLLIKSGDGYMKIPVPYGYGFFYNLGRTIAETQRTGDLGAAPWHLATSAISEFTPFNDVVVGSDGEFKSDQVFTGFLPTALKIAAQPIFNKQLFTGSELMPESQNDKSQPDREKMFRSTKGTMYDEVAGWLESAGLDVSPETLKYAVRTGTGGAGSLVDTAISAAMLKKEGAELDTGEIPFVRKAYMELGIKDRRAAFYKAQGEAREAAEEFNRIKRKNDVAKLQEFVDNGHNLELLQLNDYANKVQKWAGFARDEQDAIRADENLNVKEKRLKLKELEAQESEFYQDYLDVFKTRSSHQ